MKTVTIFVLNSFTNDSRVLKEATTLSRAGYSVTVVALHEGELAIRDSFEGVTLNRLVLRCRKLPTIKFFQLFTYLELALRVLINHRDSDIYHCCDLISLPLGVLVKIFRLGNVKLIYDAHEYEIETAGNNRRKRNILFMFEKNLIRSVDETITVSGSIADEYVRLYGIKRPLLLMNTPRLQVSIATDYFRDTFKISKTTPIFLYQGALDSGRNVILLAKVFEITELDCAVVFLGYGPLAAELKNIAERSTKIFHHDAVSPDVLHRYTCAADFGVCLIEPFNQSYYFSLPNKLFEFFMADLPVIASDFPEIETIVSQYSVGVTVQEQTEKGLENAIKELLTNGKEPYLQGLKNVSKDYCWEVQEKLFLQLYENL